MQTIYTLCRIKINRKYSCQWFQSESWSKCPSQILKWRNTFAAPCCWLLTHHLLFPRSVFDAIDLSWFSGDSSRRVFNFNQMLRLSAVTVVRVLSLKSPRNFKGCLCLWTHKGSSKPGLYRPLFMFVCPFSPRSCSSALSFFKHTSFFFVRSVSSTDQRDRLTSPPKLFTSRPTCVCLSRGLTIKSRFIHVPNLDFSFLSELALFQLVWTVAMALGLSDKNWWAEEILVLCVRCVCVRALPKSTAGRALIEAPNNIKAKPFSCVCLCLSSPPLWVLSLSLLCCLCVCVFVSDSYFFLSVPFYDFSIFSFENRSLMILFFRWLGKHI